MSPPGPPAIFLEYRLEEDLAAAERPASASSIAALGAIWAKVGFELWDDGVWVLDLTRVDLLASRQGLVLGDEVYGGVDTTKVPNRVGPGRKSARPLGALLRSPVAHRLSLWPGRTTRWDLR